MPYRTYRRYRRPWYLYNFRPRRTTSGCLAQMIVILPLMIIHFLWLVAVATVQVAIAVCVATVRGMESFTKRYGWQGWAVIGGVFAGLMLLTMIVNALSALASMIHP